MPKISVMKGLIVVDVQQDFCPGGSLGTKDGDKIIPVINKLMDKFGFVLASKDWHPEQTVHFEKWPVHCVRGTSGADFHKALQSEKITEVALKGTGNSDDGYNAFEATNLDVHHQLRKKGIDEVYVCGIATEYCVKATALAAQQAGFKTYLVTDAISAVEAKPGDAKDALQLMEESGVRMVKSDEI